MQGIRGEMKDFYVAKFHWLVSGVGRSGTTLAYSVLMSVARAQSFDSLGRYEPFLWGAPTWDKLPNDIGDAFSSTDSINTRGVFAHTQAPLFIDGSHPVLDAFIDETFPQDQSVVGKVIRGAGRLGAFLERDRELKIVHLIRNPLDVVNSALLYFSFFGGEFHPSDEERFNTEAASRLGGDYVSTFEMTEAGRSLEWWRLMNEAAIETAERFPDRLKIVAYENLMADLPGVMSEIVEFLGGSVGLLDLERLNDTVGPVTKWTSLKAVDRDEILPHVDIYFDDLRIFGENRDPVEIAAMKSRLLEKYADCKAGAAYSPQLDANLAPTRVRSLALNARQEANASRAAGDAQATAIVTKVSASVSALESKIEKVSDSVSDLDSKIEEEVKKGITTLSDQFADSVKARDASIATLVAELDDRDSQLAKLEAALKETKTLFAESKRDAALDLQSLRQLNTRLQDRVAVLKDEANSQASAFEKQRIEKRDVSDKLRKTEERLRTVAGEREQYRRQLTELTSILAPRLRTLVTLRPLRYVMRQRKRVKAGLVEIDSNGVVTPKK